MGSFPGSWLAALMADLTPNLHTSLLQGSTSFQGLVLVGFLNDDIFISVAEIGGATYWRTPFVSLCSPKQLTAYMVMQVDYIMDKDRPRVMGQVSNKVRK